MSNYEIPRLSGDFNRGYTQAIQDIQEIVNYIQPDLKHHHKSLSPKLLVQLLDCVLKNREEIRDQKYLAIKYRGFIRWNSNGFFEFYKPKINQGGNVNIGN